MQLIGMLDSPYVRRAAISLQLLGLPFEHRSISVFRMFDEFQRVNPVVTAPTLVCDDGEVLMAWVEDTTNGEVRHVDFRCRQVACAGN